MAEETLSLLTIINQINFISLSHDDDMTTTTIDTIFGEAIHHASIHPIINRQEHCIHASWRHTHKKDKSRIMSNDIRVKMCKHCSVFIIILSLNLIRCVWGEQRRCITTQLSFIVIAMRLPRMSFYDWLLLLPSLLNFIVLVMWLSCCVRNLCDFIVT